MAATTAFGISPERDAHYFHASTYQIDEATVKELTRLFRQLARQWVTNPNDYQLSFDDRDHVFELQVGCGHEFGVDLDGLLRDLLKRLINQQTAAADAGENGPSIRRFPDSLAMEQFDDFVSEDSDAEISDNGSGDREALAMPDAHVINMDGAGIYRKAKAFRWKELPATIGLLARSRNNDIRPLLSFRQVRWEEKLEQHLFGGETGVSLPPLSQTQGIDLDSLLGVTAFNDFTSTVPAPLRIARAPHTPELEAEPEAEPEAEFKAELGPEPETETTNTWEFDGELPTVTQWLAGMGKTKQVDPSARPEATSDAVKFTGGVDEHQNTLGRPRMPKGVPRSELLAFQDMQDDEDDEPTHGKDFAALRRKKDNNGDSVSSEPSSRSSGSENGYGALRFATMRKKAAAGKGSKQPAEQPVIGEVKVRPVVGLPAQSQQLPDYRFLQGPNIRPVVARPAQSQQREISSASEASEHDVRSASGTASRTASRSASGQVSRVPKVSNPEMDLTSAGLAEDTRGYTKLDAVGLAGDAANQARWEIENHISQPYLVTNRSTTRTSDYNSGQRSEPQTSASPSTIGSASMSISDGRYLHQSQHSGFSLPALVSPMSYNDASLGGSEPWAGKSMNPSNPAPSGRLIEMKANTYNPNHSRAPQPPPGFFPSLGESRQQLLKNNALQRKPLASVKHGSDQLIDVSTGAPEPHSRRRPTVRLPRAEHQALVPNPRPVVVGDSGSESDEDKVVERLQAVAVEGPKLHRTMRQKAQKKGKSKSAAIKTTAKAKPLLELPAPLPPPRAKKQKQSTASAAQPQESRCFEKVDAFLGANDAANWKMSGLEVQFGIILLNNYDGLAAENAMRCSELQERLDGIALSSVKASLGFVHFLKPLARQDVDAAFLLNLPQKLACFSSEDYKPLQDAWVEHDMEVEVVYEVHLSDLQGKSWTVTIPQNEIDEEPREPTMKPAFNNKSSIYMHCPVRVWDARIQIAGDIAHGRTNQVNDKLAAAIETFVKSFNTPDAARGSLLPGFEAYIPEIEGTPTFQIDRVFAKRIFLQRIALGRGVQVGEQCSGSTQTANVTAKTAGWQVTQVWDLLLFSGVEAKRDADIVAVVCDEPSMKERRRLFWEAQLQLDAGLEQSNSDNEFEGKETRASTLKAVETKVNEILLQLDNVGLGGADRADSAASVRARSKAEARKPRAQRVDDMDRLPFW